MRLRMSFAVLASILLAAPLALFSGADDSSAQAQYVRPLDARHSPYVGGNRSPRLPVGQPGRIAVVARGIYDGDLPIVVRNNTTRTLVEVQITGVATGASGRILATGSAQGLNPYTIRPGEIAFGYVYFSDASLPSNAQYKLTVTSSRSTNFRDLVIKQASLAIDRVVGIAQNRQSTRVSIPKGSVACFNDNGKLLRTYQDFADQGDVPSRGSLPFQVEIYGDCPVYLVAVAGLPL